MPANACTQGTQGAHGPDRITRVLYTPAGRTARVRTGVGTALERDGTVLSYTPNGLVSSLIDGEDNLTFYGYDGHDRLAFTFYPAAAKGALTPSQSDYEALGYDPAGHVVSRRLRSGEMIGYAYDPLGRLSYTDNPLSATSVTDADVAHSYDLAGRLLRVSDSNGHFARYTYDKAGRVTSEESLDGGVKTMAYDAEGRMVRMGWPDGFAVAYDHLRTGEVIRLRAAPEGANETLVSIDHDALGRRTYLSRINDTYAYYTYDGASRLAELRHDLGGTAHDLTLGFAYNPASQIVTQTRSNPLYSFAIANQTAGSATNGLNQLVTTAGTAVTHDARGNTTSDGATTFGYNLKNQLVAMNGVSQLYYDPTGRLTQQSNGGGTLDWVGDKLVGELGAKRYVHGPGVDEPLVSYDLATGTRAFLHADERGSIIAVSDDAGAVVSVNTYDEYGVPGASNAGRFQYTGQAWLPEIKVQYSKARMYNPDEGRFLQTDPLGYKDGMNWYVYAWDDPINRKDPTGKNGCAVGAAIGAIGGGIGAVPGCLIGATVNAVGALACAAYCGDAANWISDHLFNESTPQIDADKQGKHQPGHRNFDPNRGRSEVTDPDPQGLVDEAAGSGQQIGSIPVGEAGSKERYDWGRKIGNHVDPDTEKRSPTTTGIIHYDKKGNVHIVPARPVEEDMKER